MSEKLPYDLTGIKLGHLTILERDYSRKGEHSFWKCQCDCGNIITKSRSSLRRGEALYCHQKGCSFSPPRGGGKFIDLTGQKFGRLTVLKNLGKKNGGNEYYWLCECECGNKIETRGVSLRSNAVKSCGCLKKETDKQAKGNVKNMIAQKFGHLTVIERDGSDINGQAKWLCKCDCENESIISVLGDNLRKGHTKSCGCDRSSHGEKKIALLLLDNNIPFETQKVFFKYNNGHIAPFDFYVNNQYIIEYDGETHYQYNLHGWHNKEQLKAQQERDIIKNQWCLDNNIPLIRIPFTHLENISIQDLKLETSQFIINNNYNNRMENNIK